MCNNNVFCCGSDLGHEMFQIKKLLNFQYKTCKNAMKKITWGKEAISGAPGHKSDDESFSFPLLRNIRKLFTL